MKPAIVIPALDEADYLEDTVRACRAAAGEEGLEAVLVDGGSSDETVALARRLGLTVITSPPGRGVQMNAGAAATLGDPIVFLHADTRLPHQAFAAIERTLADQRVVSGSFPIRLDAPGLAYGLVAAMANLRTRLDRTPYGDQGLFVRREAFVRVGGFPAVPLLEDVILARKLRKVGRHVFPAGPPLVTSARRWSSDGMVATTLGNWFVRLAWELGVAPERLARFYHRRHGRRRPIDKNFPLF